VPLHRRVQAFLKVLRLEGAGGDIQTVETVEVNGDVSRMTVEPEAR
jgi:hypothetical protein